MDLLDRSVANVRTMKFEHTTGNKIVLIFDALSHWEIKKQHSRSGTQPDCSTAMQNRLREMKYYTSEAIFKIRRFQASQLFISLQ